MSMTYDEFLKAAAEPLEPDWHKYGRLSARRHVERLLKERGLANFGQYAELLGADAAEAERSFFALAVRRCGLFKGASRRSRVGC